MLKRHVTRVFTVLFLLLVVALVVGQALGQPLLVSFVTSESMSPTIEAGDGFVVLPGQVSEEIEEGDVIVFEAQELDDGGLTTHRVVGETEAGYITQGDANPFTDQDGGEPPVTDDRIVATAPEVNGQVITIPRLGTAVLGLRNAVLGVQETFLGALGFDDTGTAQGAGMILILSGVVLLFVTTLDSFRRRPARDRSRSRRRDVLFDPRLAVLFLVLVLLVPANAAMLGPTTTHDLQIDGAEVTTGPDGVEPGEPVETEVTATNSGLVGMLVVLDAPAEDVVVGDSHLGVSGGDSDTTIVSAPAPPPDADRTVTVTEQRYIIVLPESTLAYLHAVSPWLAIGAINAVLAFGVLTVVVGLVGLRQQRLRRTGRNVPLSVRIRRLFR